MAIVINVLKYFFRIFNEYFHYILLCFLGFLLITISLPNIIFLFRSFFSAGAVGDLTQAYWDNGSSLFIFEKIYGSENFISSFYKNSGMFDNPLGFFSWLIFFLVFEISLIIITSFLIICINIVIYEGDYNSNHTSYLIWSLFFGNLVALVLGLTFSAALFLSLRIAIIFITSDWNSFWPVIWLLIKFIVYLILFIVMFFIGVWLTKCFWNANKYKINYLYLNFFGSIYNSKFKEENFSNLKKQQFNKFLKKIKWNHSKIKNLFNFTVELSFRKPLIFVFSILASILFLILFVGINWLQLSIIIILYFIISIFPFTAIFVVSFRSFSSYLLSFKKNTSNEKKYEMTQKLINHLIFLELVDLMKEKHNFSIGNNINYSSALKFKKTKINFSFDKIEIGLKIKHHKYLVYFLGERSIGKISYNFEDKFVGEIKGRKTRKKNYVSMIGNNEKIINEFDESFSEIIYLIKKKFMSDSIKLPSFLVNEKGRIKKANEERLSKWIKQSFNFSDSSITKEVALFKQVLYENFVKLFNLVKFHEKTIVENKNTYLIEEYFNILLRKGEAYRRNRSNNGYDYQQYQYQRQQYNNKKKYQKNQEQNNKYREESSGTSDYMSEIKRALDFYELSLGTLNRDILKKKWRETMKKHHPDSNHSTILDAEICSKANRYNDVLNAYLDKNQKQ